MTAYQLICTDRQGNSLGELTDAQLESAKWELNGPGEIKYTMPQNSAQILIPQEHINEVQLWINKAGTPTLSHWGFHEDTDEGPNTCSFTCPGLLAYMGGRFVTNTSYSYGVDAKHNPIGDGVDTLDIMADLWVKKAYDLNIGVKPYFPSGINRFAFFDLWSHQNMLTDVIGSFTDKADATGSPTGVDFDITFDTDGNRWFTMYYPVKGNYFPDLGLEWGKNITDYTNAVKGSAQGNSVWYTGGSNGDIKFEAHATATSDELANYGHWEAIQSQSGENDVGVLGELANRYMNQHKYPLKMPTINVVEVPEALLGVIGPGDIVPVKIIRGRTKIDATYRIASVEWLPGPGNLKLQLIDPSQYLESYQSTSLWFQPDGFKLDDYGAAVTFNDLEGT